MTRCPVTGLALSAWIAALAAPALASGPPAEVTVRDGRLFPESMTATVDGALLFGSSTTSTILRAGPGESEARPWFDGKDAALGRVLGVLADEGRGILWVCSSSSGAEQRGESLTGLAAFRLSDHGVIGTYPFPDGQGLCNDMAVDGEGAVYVTDTTGGRVLRLAGPDGRLEVWADDPLLAGADGVAVTPDGAVYVNAIFSGQLLRLDPAEGGGPATAVKLRLSRELGLPDGMRTAPDGSLIVAEQAGRVSRIRIAGDEAQVDTIADGFREPAAVAIVGDRAYVLQSNLSVNRDPKRKGEDPGPARAVAVPLDGSPAP